jgi:hypothetical protein
METRNAGHQKNHAKHSRSSQRSDLTQGKAMHTENQTRKFAESNIDLINFKLALDNRGFQLTLSDVEKLSDEELNALIPITLECGTF